MTQFIFVCNSDNKNDVERFVDSRFHWPKKLAKSTVFYASERYSSPVEAIAELLSQNIINRDFLIVNGDLLTECNINELIDYHYINDNLITAACNASPTSRVVLLTEEQSNNIISVTNQDELKSKGLKLRPIMMNRHKSFEIKTGSDFAGIFMVSQKLKPVILYTNNNFVHFGDEFIPFVANYQYNSKLLSMINSQVETSKNEEDGTEDDEENNLFAQPSAKITRIKVQVYLFKGYNKRVNSLAEYIQINLEAIDLMNKNPVFTFTENNDKLLEVEADPNSKRRPAPNIISAEAEIANLLDIKKSVIGKNCRIGKNVIISNSIILKDTEIEDGCKIENCCIGMRAIIKAGSHLKDCAIGDMCLVSEKSKLVNDVMSFRGNDGVEIIRKASFNG
jgi:ADP-glucose pyrophosphorylase